MNFSTATPGPSQQRRRRFPAAARLRMALPILAILAAACVAASGQTLPTATTPSAPAAERPPVLASSLIVKFGDGLSPAEQQAVIARNGGTETSSVPALRLHTIEASGEAVSTILANYQADAQVASVEQQKIRGAGAVPSDPAYADQWALPKIGWDSVFGNVSPAGSATIAVLDTGVDAGQTDLAGRLVPGFSAFDGSDPTADPNGHGTWLASIAAAATDNSDGIAGVAYGNVSIMPVQVLDANGAGLDSDVIAGLIWAADHNANVVLMGFSNPGYSQNLQDAIDYAWSKGAVLVAATGNDGSATSTFPAGAAKVMGVSATDSSDSLWPGSNYGQDTFIAAPGVDITADAVSSGTTSISGTSASSAFVAGAAALLQANDPSATNGAIVGRLARNADPAGNQEQTGNGRLNLARAIADASTDPVTPTGTPGGGPLVAPYLIAAQLSGQLQGQSKPPCNVTTSQCTPPWQTNALTGWAELETAPLRLFFDVNQQNRTNTFTISIDHASGVSTGLENLTNFA